MRKYETILRSRRLRVAVAISFAATGLWAFTPYVLNEVGGEAYVNAPLTRVTSPIAGVAGGDLPAIGSYVATAKRLRVVTSRSVDETELGGLMGQQAALSAALALADRQLSELSAMDSRLKLRAERYGRAEGKRLADWAIAAGADTQACRAEADEAQNQAARVAALAVKGYAAKATVDRAEAALAGARARCAGLTARASASAQEAMAARAGVYLGNGTADTPYAEQQRDRLLLRRQELESVAVDAQARLEELARRVERERHRLAQAAAYDVTLPAASIVWQVGTSPGSSVVPGSSLIDLADCTRRFVDVTLPERRIEALVPGQAVKVRLIGAGSWQTGHVVRVSGAAARRDVAMVAASESDHDPRALTVEVSLPPAPRAAVARRCDIGRLAEVRFSRWIG
jgi:multidrug resistance efflux pump